MMQQIKHFN